MASSKDRKKSDGTDNTHNNPSGSQKNSVSSEYDSRDAKKDKYLKQKKKINYYLSKEDINYLVQNTRFSEQELREWHQNFREECPDGILDKDAIMKIYDEISPLGNSKDFVDHIFRIFDKDASGSIDFIEFMMATDMTASGTPEEKLRWAFKMYDKDGSGTIELNEMIEVMTALQCMDGASKEAAQVRGRRIFEELDINDDGEISCEEFVRGCMMDPELVRTITAGGLDPLEEECY